MLRSLVFGLGLLSATILSHGAFAAGGRTFQIVVSKDKQSMVVYDGDQVVTTTRVSTGKAGHTTPSGIFSILEKRKYHESNIYSNAPMPWMQRLTWSGIALHEGVVPNYPASHGCIRMPGAFAKSLFDMTERGAHVIVSDAPVVPQRIESATLFMPRKPLPKGPLLTDVELRASAIDVSKKAEVAMNMRPENPALSHPADAPVVEAENDSPPLRILITRRGDRETLVDVQHLLQGMGFETGGTDGYLGPMTRSAIEGFKRWKGVSAKGGLINAEFIDALYASAGKEKPPAGQIMVRRNFQPLFEAPVGIKSPEVALGTHFFAVDKIERSAEAAEWTAVSLPNGLSDATKKRLGIAAESPATANAAQAWERIEIPSEIREQIENLMTDGTSVTINDEGLGPETGKGTDFVTLTKPVARAASAVAEKEPSITKPKPVRQTRSEQRRGMIGLY
jgi:peptidoglycan hydrolase-like protein with peptidoglycan-binding domain